MSDAAVASMKITPNSDTLRTVSTMEVVLKLTAIMATFSIHLQQSAPAGVFSSLYTQSAAFQLIGAVFSGLPAMLDEVRLCHTHTCSEPCQN
jgi:hypothetical protein